MTMENTTPTTNYRGAQRMPFRRVPNRIREYRIAKDVSCPQIADAIGYTYPAVHKAETQNTGSVKLWMRIAEYLDTTVETLKLPPSAETED